jgi:hypothetical protein
MESQMFNGALTLAGLITAASVASSPALAGHINIVGGHIISPITPRVTIPAPSIASKVHHSGHPVRYMEFKLKEVFITSVH